MAMLHISDEIQDAKANRQPVVALESTIIAHGFPYPDNRRLADALDATVRKAGAVPAFIGLIEGRAHIGLDGKQLDRMAGGPDVLKCSLRDLGLAAAGKRDGATTVAATAFLAHKAGIEVFATGGIGGVHPQIGDGPPDVSADLLAMARTPLAIVSAGAKSILDLPATLEMLESYGVPVIGFGTREFPAFHARISGLALSQVVDGVEDLAAIVRSHLDFGLESALLVCNPPPEAEAIPRPELDDLVAAALAWAAREGVVGKALTPYLLKALDELSDGRTTAVTRALALSNAELGAQLAAALMTATPEA